MNHRLGIQSNVLVAARYNHDLSKPEVYAAVRSIVTTHPGLATVAEMYASGKKGHHDVRHLLLHTVNLDYCVEFVEREGADVDARFIEEVHNKGWYWTSVEPGQPWWKVIVLNRRSVVFVFHHMLCDGRFGVMFHRDFLAVLNSPSGDLPSSALDPIIRIDPATAKLPDCVPRLTDMKPSIIRGIFGGLFCLFLSLFASRLFFSDLPPPKPMRLEPAVVVEPEERTVARIEQRRIPADKMARILAACRAHQTTFSPLLNVLTTMVLAVDHYPKATLGFFRTAVDARPQLNACASGAEIMDGASGVYNIPGLAPFREADAKKDPALVWKLVKAYGDEMHRAVWSKSTFDLRSSSLGEYLVTSLLDLDLEGIISQVLPSMQRAMNHCIVMSNIGAFPGAPPVDGAPARWQVDDMQFSAAPLNRICGSDMVFDVAGVKGHDTVLTVNYTQGVLADERVDAILNGIMDRLDALIQE